MSPIVWLASYPKSGNTWLRLLLANLGRDTPVDINQLKLQGGVASGRPWFDTAALVPAGLLSHAESDRVRPSVYRAAPEGEPPPPGPLAGRRFVKTHDAWTLTDRGEPLMGGAAAARGAVLAVRDPRDVAVSLAHHLGETVDTAIAFMSDAAQGFCTRIDRQENQLRQTMLDWSGFQASWLDQRAIPVYLVRYEDLHAAPARTLAALLGFAGIGASDAAVARAADFADFGAIRAQEEAQGFREAPGGSSRFFRRGVVGGWRDDLVADQIAAIESDHAAMMARIGYDLELPRRNDAGRVAREGGR